MTSEKKQKEKIPPETGAEKQSAETGEKSSAVEDSPENISGETENFEEKYNKLNDRFLRLAADFENYKKRLQKEKEQARIDGVRELAASIFRTMDSLDLALRHGSQKGADSEGLIRGVRLTYEQALSQLKNFGINQVSAEVGEKFNPVLHEAVENSPSEDVEKGLIVREIAKGYTAGEVLIRPVVVAVSSGRGEKPSEDEKREE